MTRFRVPGRWLVLGLIAVMLAVVPASWPTAGSRDRHFRIEASSFAYAPAGMTVNPGDHVTIDLVATDVVHGLYIDGYDLNVTADPGQTASLSFVADRAGTFRFRCSVTCGALHPFMIGKLRVGQNRLLWRGLAVAMLASVAGVWLVRPAEKRHAA